MLEELLDLGAGFGVALLPALLLAVPGIILFVVLPAILMLALVAPLAVIAVPPILVARWLRRRRHDGHHPRTGSGASMRALDRTASTDMQIAEATHQMQIASSRTTST